MSDVIDTTAWIPADVARIADQRGWALPVITAADVRPMLPDTVVWDMWQVMDRDGATIVRDGRQFWFFMAAPRTDDPDTRHDVAHIRLTSFGSDGWRDHGRTFPDGFTPGSREWSGSSVLDDDGETLTMYFTASGRHGQARTFEQRLFETVGRFDARDGEPSVVDWSTPVESFVADGHWYRRVDQIDGVDGRIKGFRDPGYFRDPADGAEYLLFVGSAAWIDAIDDGVIGIARREAGRWVPQPPPIASIGLNSELERPHIIVRDGLYYLFWSTQTRRFAEGGPTGPVGLYAMVADRIGGPWRPVNGTGLVAANPPEEPAQAYCWWVTGELDVLSFVDLYALGGQPPAQPAGRNFGGVPAPFFHLTLDGDRVTIG